MAAVVGRAAEPGRSEREGRGRTSSLLHAPLSRRDLSPSFCHPQPPCQGGSVAWQLGAQASEAGRLGSSPDLVALPVSTFSLLEPWFSHLHFGIASPVLGLRLMMADVTRGARCSGCSERSVNTQWVPSRQQQR